MKHLKLSALVTSTLLITQIIGCATTGMSQREGPGRDQSAYLSTMMTTPLGEWSNPEPTTFKASRRLAVSQIGELAPPKKFVDKLGKSDLFNSVSVVPAISNGQQPREHLQTLCNLARATGADYLLLIGGTVESDTRATALSLLNVTVIGMFVVPSDLTSGELKASAAMIDAKTGQIAYLSSAQRSGSVMSTYVANDEAPARLARKLRNEAAGSLADAVIADGKRQAMLTSNDAQHELAAGTRNPRLTAIPRFLTQ